MKTGELIERCRRRKLDGLTQEAADTLERIVKAWGAFAEYGTHDNGAELVALRRAISGEE